MTKLPIIQQTTTLPTSVAKGFRVHISEDLTSQAERIGLPFVVDPHMPSSTWAVVHESKYCG